MNSSYITSTNFDYQLAHKDTPMPLIIDSYECPYTRITSLLFPEQEVEYLDAPISESENEETYYYIHEEQANVEAVKYYFNKIYYPEGDKIVCIYKRARKIKYYDLNTGNLIQLEAGEDGAEVVDKSAFLPYLKAQEGELVLFPEEDDEI